MEYQVRLIDQQKDKIISLSKEYNLSEYINDILKGADWVMLNWTYNKNPERYFTEIFALIYTLQYGDLSQYGIKVKGVIDNENFSFNIHDEKLSNKLINYLKSFISDETKNFYYNNFIIDCEEEEEDENDRIFSKLMTLKKGSKPLTPGQEIFFKDYICKMKHNSQKTDTETYRNFFSKESLKKIIEYEYKQQKTRPKTKNKLIGYFSNMLFKQYKYNVFGYMRSYTIIGFDDETKEEKIWELHKQSIKEEPNKKLNESSFIHISKYQQYVFIYSILRILNILSEDENIKSNHDKYNYISKCLSAYHKSSKELG